MESVNYSTMQYPEIQDTYIIKEVNECFSKPKINSMEDAFHLFTRMLSYLDDKREHFISASLDTKNHLISSDIISIGSLNTNIVHPREVFYCAIANRAAAIVVAHNHPSGETAPSQNDLDITRKLIETGKIIGINVCDHLIIGWNEYFSFRDQNIMEF